MKGCVLPFGGAKGSALSFIFDILSGVLTGAAYGKFIGTQIEYSREQNIGHLFIAIRTDIFLSKEQFLLRVDDIIGQLKSIPAVPGFQEVLAPGEPQNIAERNNRKEGIPLSEDRIEKLKSLAVKLGVQFPSRIA